MFWNFNVPFAFWSYLTCDIIQGSGENFSASCFSNTSNNMTMIFTSVLSPFALSLLLTGILWMLKKSFEILPSLEYKKVNLSTFIPSHSPAGCKWHVVNLKFYLAFLKFPLNSGRHCHLKDFSSLEFPFLDFFHFVVRLLLWRKIVGIFLPLCYWKNS